MPDKSDAAPARPRVVVVANKWWECDPLMGVLLHDHARPKDKLGWPNILNHPRHRPDSQKLPPAYAEPRAVFDVGGVDVEIWCVSDLLEHLPANLQSSTQSKAQVLPKVKTWRDKPPPSFVIAFGTAGYPNEITENGSVVVGTRVFLHDGHPPPNENPVSKWHDGPFLRVLPSALGADDFNHLTTIEQYPVSVMNRFVVEPLNPARYGQLVARSDFVALGTLNVTDYGEYEDKDKETLARFVEAEPDGIWLARSVETTHGLIRVLLGEGLPFLFISGITDRVGHFGDEVGPRPYAQNTAAAHNAAIVLAWMLPRVAAFVLKTSPVIAHQAAKAAAS